MSVTRCRDCGLPTEFHELEAGNGYCKYCVGGIHDQKNHPSRAHAVSNVKLPDDQANGIVMSTSPYVPGKEVTDIIEIVASEVALGMNFLKDVANSWRDTFGGRSASLQRTLKEARQECLIELRQAAARCGADAVISVRLDYSQISTTGGSGGSILFVAASGTAVKLM